MPDIRIVPGSSIMSFTSSLNFTERITQDASGSLNLYGSGSTGRTELFSIDGGNGRLFTVSDDLSDSLFARSIKFNSRIDPETPSAELKSLSNVVSTEFLRHYEDVLKFRQNA